MRLIEQRVWQHYLLDVHNEQGFSCIAFLGNVRLDCRNTLCVLDRVLHHYEKLAHEQALQTIMLAGHFVCAHALADSFSGHSNCIVYKEGFNFLIIWPAAIKAGTER
jgi:hypothetical protein